MWFACEGKSEILWIVDLWMQVDQVANEKKCNPQSYCFNNGENSYQELLQIYSSIEGPIIEDDSTFLVSPYVPCSLPHDSTTKTILPNDEIHDPRIQK